MSPRARKIALGFSVAAIFITALVISLYSFLRPSPQRTNFLILGVAGEGHVAGDLTDTIIFLSLDPQTRRIIVLSLPRDIWIPALRTKLNSVYHYRGMEETKKIVAEILGQPIDYGLLINFDIFTEAIDVLGGVEVEVDQGFDDYRYPLLGKENDLCDGDPEYNCRYEHLHFEAGKQLMDGERALKYVRSRYAEGDEGTDFARSSRQQKLLLAIKDKLLSPQILFDPRKPVQLIKVVFDHLETDLSQEDYDDLIRLTLRFKSPRLQMETLAEDYLLNPPLSQEKYDRQWVLIPRADDWQAVQEYVQGLFKVD